VTKGKTITLLDSTSEPWELLEEPGRCPMRVRAVNYPRFIEPTANHPSTQQEVRLDSPIDKLLMSVSNFAAELERAKASQRRRDALQVKAQRGYVVGGACSATATSQYSVMVVSGRTSCARSVRTKRRRSGASSRWSAPVPAFGRSLRP